MVMVTAQRHLSLVVTAALLAGAAALAHAPRASAQYVVVDGSQYGNTQTPAQEQQQQQRRIHKFGSFTIAVPIAYDVNLDVVKPGAHLDLRGGVDWGMIGVFTRFGLMWTPINLDAQPETIGYGQSPLTRMSFGFGVRLQYDRHPRFRAYADLQFDFNWWHVRESSYGCGWWYCTTYDNYRFAPGWTLRPGLQIIVKDPIAIDVGCGFGFSYPGDFFDRAQYWLEPFLGIAVRH